MSSARTKTPLLSPGQAIEVESPRGELFLVDVIRPLGPTRTVFLGKRQGTQESVVLKLPRGRPGIEDRIEREITAQFDHPNLIRLLGVSVIQGRDVLVLPKLGPNPLLLLNERQVRSRLSRDPGTKYFPLPPNVAVELLAELLRGLETLHAAGFAHNDVKISNLLIDTGQPLSGVKSLEAVGQGRYRGVLIDLGAARSLAFLEDARLGRIDTDFVPPQLTPAYAPPEVLTTQGRPAFSPPADIYAAGLTAYALYTGHYPYDHLDPAPTFSDFAEVAALKARERRGEIHPCDLRGLEWIPWHDVEVLARETTREAIEASFRDLLKRMTAADPTKRPTAAKALAELEWIFQLDARRGKSSVAACTILRLKPENRLTEALAKDNEQTPKHESRADRITETPLSIWGAPRESGEATTNPPPEEASAERAWSRPANADQVSTETLVRYALRAVEGLVAASESPAPPLTPAPSPEAVEYEALLKVIGAALGTGLPAPEPPPPPRPPEQTPGVGVGDLLAWHKGELDAGASPVEGMPTLGRSTPPLPFAAPTEFAPPLPVDGFRPTMTFRPTTELARDPLNRALAMPTPAAPPLPQGPATQIYGMADALAAGSGDQQPELREMKRAELFTVRDTWLAAALSRSGLLGPEAIAEALGAHVTARRPLAAILRERYLNTEVVEALRVLARALAQQPHDI